MKSIWKRAVKGLIAVLAVAQLTACAGGAAFKRVEEVPADKALVYIYRPSSMFGMAIHYNVRVNDKVVTDLRNGGYFPYIGSPGELVFSAKTEASSSVTLDAKAGQTYYVKGTVGLGAFAGRPHLTLVPLAEGAEEIKDCKLLGAAK